jgi:hypothetical protein
LRLFSFANEEITMLQCYVLTCGRSVTAFSAPPRSQRPGHGPRSPHPKAGPVHNGTIPLLTAGRKSSCLSLNPPDATDTISWPWDATRTSPFVSALSDVGRANSSHCSHVCSKHFKVRNRRRTSGQLRVIITTICSATTLSRRSNWLETEMPAYLAEIPYPVISFHGDFHYTTCKHQAIRTAITITFQDINQGRGTQSVVSNL